MNNELIAEVEEKMNEGVNPLQSVITILDAQKKVKRDMIIPAGHMSYSAGSGLLEVVNGAEIEQYTITEHTHQQIADKLGIPRQYYRKLQSEYKDLLAENINMWLSKKEKTSYLLRTFNYPEGEKVARAVLSNRYNIIDNWDVLVCALEAIKKTGIHVEIVKSDVTDLRMYLHVVAPEIHIEATRLLDGYLENRNTAHIGNGIISGLVISNSEVGMGRFEISARAQILKCKNGLHDRNAAFKKTHLGAKMEDGDIQWSQNTRNKNYELIMAQVNDAVKVYLSEDYLGQLTTKLEGYKANIIEQPTKIIELVNKELQIPEDHADSILKYFLKDNDESVFGMMNAYTRHSQKLGADMQYDIESGIFELLPTMDRWNNKLQSKN